MFSHFEFLTYFLNHCTISQIAIVIKKSAKIFRRIFVLIFFEIIEPIVAPTIPEMLIVIAVLKSISFCFEKIKIDINDVGMK